MVIALSAEKRDREVKLASHESEIAHLKDDLQKFNNVLYESNRQNEELKQQVCELKVQVAHHEASLAIACLHGVFGAKAMSTKRKRSTKAVPGPLKQRLGFLFPCVLRSVVNLLRRSHLGSSPELNTRALGPWLFGHLHCLLYTALVSAVSCLFCWLWFQHRFRTGCKEPLFHPRRFESVHVLPRAQSVSSQGLPSLDAPQCGALGHSALCQLRALVMIAFHA